ncbi:MAG: GGDEF domain-containing protein [Acetivibrionales bacterium]|jgi:diguanylate cyclase (GGDEF)-like protein
MKRRSGFIFVIIIILILFNGTNIFLFQRYKGMVAGDAEIINNLGTIRGSVQRYTKLELVSGENEHISDKIENLFEIYKNLNTPFLNETREKWEEVKEASSKYRSNPGENNRKLLIEASEECWEMADKAILETQYIAENKIDYLILPIVFLVLGLVFALVLIFIIKKYVYDNLESFAVYDHLTRAHNRRYFIEFLKREILRAERKNTAFSLVMFDIDHFKNINDTYGHSTGDEVLITLNNIVRRVLRKSDVLSRIGGEEFTILLPDENIKEAVLTAERARKTVEKHEFGDIGKVTISFGVTSYQEGDMIDDILKRADTALYIAKNAGRNRVETV